MSNITKIVKCPTCGKSTEYSANNPFRPFCSDRCRTLDLGAWADEKYRVSESQDPDAFEESETVNEKSDEPESENGNLPPHHQLN